jgi:hypothetical protein
MLALFEILGIYSALAAIAVYGIWRLIGQQGFIGLEDTDSPLAKHFRKRSATISAPKPTVSGAEI